MDFKELIWRLRYSTCEEGEIQQAAAVIETLLAERDAALDDLCGLCWCCAYGKKWDKAPEWSKLTACEHMREFGSLACSGKNTKCSHWKWRGPKTDKAGESDG